MGAIGNIAGGIAGSGGGNPLEMIGQVAQAGIQAPQQLVQQLMQIMEQAKGGEDGGSGMGM